jgi:hypothetical protein
MHKEIYQVTLTAGTTDYTITKGPDFGDAAAWTTDITTNIIKDRRHIFLRDTAIQYNVLKLSFSSITDHLGLLSFLYASLGQAMSLTLYYIDDELVETDESFDGTIVGDIVVTDRDITVNDCNTNVEFSFEVA